MEPNLKCMLRYETAADAMDKAMEHYPAHSARCDEFHGRGDLLMVGTFADPREGALAIFRSRAAAEDFVAGDPFVEHGVVASYEMKDWNEVYAV